MTHRYKDVPNNMRQHERRARGEEVTEHALGVERPLSSLWALVIVPREEAGLEQYLQVGPMQKGERAFCHKTGNA